MRPPCAVFALSPSCCLALLACTGAPPPATPDLPVLCRQLVAAAPDAWTPALQALHRHGRAAAAPLVDAIRRDPAAPGAGAAVALLGMLDKPGAAPFLLELVGERGTLALEAALALGRLGEPQARAMLVRCADDRFADATLRTAAACAAVRPGAGAEVAPLLHGVMVAATPAGQTRQRELGLPDKPRWAYERYLIQQLLRDCNPGDPGFDTDAPWAELERAGTRLGTWLAQR